MDDGLMYPHILTVALRSIAAPTFKEMEDVADALGVEPKVLLTG